MKIRHLGVVRNDETPKPAEKAPEDAEYQTLLRRRIAALERLQRQRIELVQKQKADMDRVVGKAAAEIETLKRQQTIGVVK